jgi:hypothetical protein
VYLYLNYLYTCFLLQRALIKHTNTGQEMLCDLSRRVLGIVNTITTMRNPMVDLDRHYSWIVCINSGEIQASDMSYTNWQTGPYIRCPQLRRPAC